MNDELDIIRHPIPPDQASFGHAIAFGVQGAAANPHLTLEQRHAVVHHKLSVLWSRAVTHGRLQATRWFFWSGLVAGAVAAFIVCAVGGAL